MGAKVVIWHKMERWRAVHYTRYHFGVGGTAGDAIHGISFIFWVNMGTIYRATS